MNIRPRPSRTAAAPAIHSWSKAAPVKAIAGDVFGAAAGAAVVVVVGAAAGGVAGAVTGGGVTGSDVVLVGHGVGVVALGVACGALCAAAPTEIGGSGPFGSVSHPGPDHRATFETLPVVPVLIVTLKVAVTDLPMPTPKKSHVRVLLA
jgi:hypothetical protein